MMGELLAFSVVASDAGSFFFSFLFFPPQLSCCCSQMYFLYGLGWIDLYMFLFTNICLC